MSEASETNGQGVYSRIETAIADLRRENAAANVRIEDKLDIRLNTLDAKVDGVASRQDRLEGKLEGSIGMVRWLGPTGIVAVIFAIAKASGLL